MASLARLLYLKLNWHCRVRTARKIADSGRTEGKRWTERGHENCLFPSLKFEMLPLISYSNTIMPLPIQVYRVQSAFEFDIDSCKNSQIDVQD